MHLPYLLNAALFATTVTANYNCVTFDVPLSFVGQSLPPTFPRFKNHYEAVGLLETITSRNFSKEPFGSPQNVSVDVTVAAQYCSDSHARATVVQVLTHGIGFDRSYWEFGSKDSQYNYIKAATEAGYATLSYDRIGTGNSSFANPYTILQQGIEIEVLINLTKEIRDGTLSKYASHMIPKPAKVVHVGHSFGSSITSGFAGAAPGLSDGVVLTGYSTNGSWGLNFAIASGFHLASETLPSKFGHLDKGFLTWPDELANQFLFFHYPQFDPKVLAGSERTKAPFSVGELLNVNGGPAPAWNGPLLIISGEYDKILCGSDCYGILAQAKSSYPKAKPFRTYVQPSTGHGMNLHYNATGFYGVVNDFIGSNIG